MSTQETETEQDDGPGQREVAHRVLAAEYDDATLSHREGDEERAPTYVVTPSGAKANRLFLVGVLTEVERVNDEMLRARIVDPTGAFIVYAGQYQPEARATFERASTPEFVAVTGKARTFQPKDADRIYSSVRPESVNVVDADVRDRWAVEAARATLRRVGRMADALRRDAPGDPTGGVALALDHYGTTPGYLAALRDLAIDAAAIVADDRDEVDSFDAAPDADRPGVDLDDLAAVLDVEAVAGEAVERRRDDGGPSDRSTDASAADEIAEITAADDVEAFDADDADDGTTTDDPAATTASADEATDVDAFAGGNETGSTSTASSDADTGPDGDDVGDVDSADEVGDFEPGDIGADGDDGGADETAEGGDEVYEMDDEERERIESEFGTEFSTGTEVESPDAADVRPSDADPESASGTEQTADEAQVQAEVEDEVEADAGAGAEETTLDEATTAEPTGDEERATDAEPDADAGPAEDDAATAPGDGETTDEGAAVDEVLLERMHELDDGDGAERGALIEAVVDATGADAGAVEDAIQDALMSGQCYEPSEDHLKPI
jgi:RPA family protein